MKPRIVIIGAGMAGLVAASKLYKTNSSKQLFDLCIVEGGTRIGGRIQTSEFCGNRIEMGATWIHGIGGSPIHKIAQEINSLESDQPWERMDGFPEAHPLTVFEGGLELDPSIVEPISNFYKKLIYFSLGKLVEGNDNDGEVDFVRIATKALKICTSNEKEPQNISIGSFLRQGLDTYWIENKEPEGNWNRKSIEEAIFRMNENSERTYSSADDLLDIDFNAAREYIVFPDEEITIAKGYSSIIESLASVLPEGLIQLGKKVVKIDWQPEGIQIQSSEIENLNGTKPVKLHFEDGSIMETDHVIVTVSLGVLKAGIQEKSGMFDPPLPSFKTQAISRLGFGVVDKLFLQLDQANNSYENFPFLQMAFHQPDSELRHPKIPWWMRRTASLFPIYKNSSVLLAWFAGEEALELESLKDEEIINGVTTTISSFMSNSKPREEIEDSEKCSNGYVNSVEKVTNGFKFTRVLKSGWGTNPLFMGSYSYVAVGSSGDDFDLMAKPLPSLTDEDFSSTKFSPPPLQILFAGEATHRIHYSTTHGAYFSGVREANRLLKHYNCDGFSGMLDH
ncbi:Amine oxidase [Macleaya cordata]|uniref:Amine oxidase n=1 Tax=Macleaya cordata TaxID=56857 RepID=A0A200QD90_MACCD|nr:Amine oxidase [Macleaya cordata]